MVLCGLSQYGVGAVQCSSLQSTTRNSAAPTPLVSHWTRKFSSDCPSVVRHAQPQQRPARSTQLITLPQFRRYAVDSRDESP